MPRTIEQIEADIAANQADVAAIKAAFSNWASNQTYASLTSAYAELLKDWLRC